MCLDICVCWWPLKEGRYLCLRRQRIGGALSFHDYISKDASQALEKDIPGSQKWPVARRILTAQSNREGIYHGRFSRVNGKGGGLHSGRTPSVVESS